MRHTLPSCESRLSELWFMQKCKSSLSHVRIIVFCAYDFDWWKEVELYIIYVHAKVFRLFQTENDDKTYQKSICSTSQHVLVFFSVRRLPRTQPKSSDSKKSPDRPWNTYVKFPEDSPCQRKRLAIWVLVKDNSGTRHVCKLFATHWHIFFGSQIPTKMNKTFWRIDGSPEMVHKKSTNELRMAYAECTTCQDNQTGQLRIVLLQR